MTSLGFTGTQDGMTSEQGTEVLNLLYRYTPLQVHHGDCVGADEEFHALALLVGAVIHNHPPTNPIKRAFCGGDIKYPPRPYLERNQDIVSMSDVLVATPKEFTEKQRGSGTWATIRYARKKGIPIHIVYPDGKISHES